MRSNELVACARRLQANLGGTLQDERGVPLTVHRIERMRQEVREFERPPAGGGRGAGSQSAHLLTARGNDDGRQRSQERRGKSP